MLLRQLNIDWTGEVDLTFCREDWIFKEIISLVETGGNGYRLL